MLPSLNPFSRQCVEQGFTGPRNFHQAYSKRGTGEKDLPRGCELQGSAALLDIQKNLWECPLQGSQLELADLQGCEKAQLLQAKGNTGRLHKAQQSQRRCALIIPQPTNLGSSARSSRVSHSSQAPRRTPTLPARIVSFPRLPLWSHPRSSWVSSVSDAALSRTLEPWRQPCHQRPTQLPRTPLADQLRQIPAAADSRNHTIYDRQGISFITASRLDALISIRGSIWQMQRLTLDENAPKVTTWILTGRHVPIVKQNKGPGKGLADQRQSPPPGAKGRL
jgi:hypothetical protein